MIIRSETGALRSTVLHFAAIDHAASSVDETIIKEGTYTTQTKTNRILSMI